MLLADGLASFGVRFIDELGEQTSSWDSSQLIESSELPLAVEIEVALLDPEGDPDAEPQPYSRRVLLPVRPLDLEELLDPNSLVSGGEGSEADEEAEEARKESEGDDVRDGHGSQALRRGTVRQHDRVPGRQLPGEDRPLRAVDRLMLEDAMQRSQWFCGGTRTIPASLPDRQPGVSATMKRPRDSGGVVLLIVLFFALLLSSSIATFLRRSTVDAIIARNRERAARAEALARGGVRLAKALLLEDRLREQLADRPADRRPPRPLGPARGPEIDAGGGATLALRIEDTGWRLNLNALFQTDDDGHPRPRQRDRALPDRLPREDDRRDADPSRREGALRRARAHART